MSKTAQHHLGAHYQALSRNLTAMLAVTAVLFGLLLSGARAAMQDDSDGGGEEEPIYCGDSFPFDGPAILEAGGISFIYSAPGQSDFSFESSATDLEGYPGSLYLAETPFGPAALLKGSGPGDANYYLYFSSLGVLAPLNVDATGVEFVGTPGTGTFTVTAAGTQGPNGTKWCVMRDNNGRMCIYFYNTCPATTFKQFFTKTITWEGKKGDGTPASGTWSGPDVGSGNGGDIVTTDGTHVYSDSPNHSNGDYPNTHMTSYGTIMTDSPNPGNVAPIATDLQNSTASGLQVEKITVTWHFTTYVYCAGVLREKIQWTYSQTMTKPFATTLPSGSFGGPNGATGPVSTPAGTLDAQHQAALDGSPGYNYQQGNHNGAAAVNGW